MSLRQAIDRAIALPGVTASELKVFLVVVRDLASWTRLWDVRSREDIATAAGVSERTVSRAMDRLVAVRAVSWQPSRTKGKVSQVGLPDPDHETTVVSPNGATTGQLMSRTIEKHVEKKDGGHVDPDHDDGDEPLSEAEMLDIEVGQVVTTALRRLGAPLERIEQEFRARPEKIRQLDKRVSRLLKSGIEGHDLFLMLTDRDAPRHEVETYVGLLLSRSRRVQPLKKSRATA